jgi:hypothetical protein
LEPPLTRAEDRYMTRRAGDYLTCGSLNGFFQDLFPRGEVREKHRRGQHRV